MDIRPKTVFCDIDGTLIKHFSSNENFHNCELEILPGTVEKILEWDRKGYNIILTTGRRESMREYTEKQLNQVGIFYDQLIMGIGGGVRVLINDLKPGSEEKTAVAITLKRDIGISEVNI